MSRSILKIIVLLGLIWIGFVSCDLFEKRDFSGEKSDLATNKSLWEQAGHSDYSFNYTRQGLTPDNGVRYLVDVEGKVVSSVLNTSTNTVVPSSSLASFPTAAGLFDFVQGGIDRKAYKLTISYDPSFHFPTSIYIDYSQDAQDEELSVKADTLQVTQ